MGLIGTIATFGIGYAAGATTGRERLQQLTAKAKQLMPSGGISSEGSTLDVRDVRQVMTASPDTVRRTDTLQEAARLMQENDIGDVLVVQDDGQLAGIITDRDIAIRATAEGRDPKKTTVDDVYTKKVTSLAPTDTVHDAIQQMRAHDVRRLPVVESGIPIGIVSLGDISVRTAPGSVLADISTASPDR